MTAENFTIEQLATEEWRPIIGFELLYEASSLGRVRRIGAYHSTVVGRILKPSITNCGYVTVPLSRPGVKAHPHLVHRLVMGAFCGPAIAPRIQVNHKDGNKQNNCRENLEYVTRKENMQHAIRLGLRSRYLLRKRVAKGDTHYSRTKPWAVPKGSRHGMAKITEEIVQQIRAEYQEVRSYQKIADKYGLGKTTVRHIIKGDTWKGA